MGNKHSKQNSDFEEEFIVVSPKSPASMIWVSVTFTPSFNLSFSTEQMAILEKIINESDQMTLLEIFMNGPQSETLDYLKKNKEDEFIKILQAIQNGDVETCINLLIKYEDLNRPIFLDDFKLIHSPKSSIIDQICDELMLGGDDFFAKEWREADQDHFKGRGGVMVLLELE